VARKDQQIQATPSRGDEMQSITLLIDGVSIPIDVLRSEEPYYRRAQHTMMALIKKYRTAYPQPLETGDPLHWLMAAVDIAVQCEMLRESREAVTLLERVAEVNALLEREL
jgi:hypothetical protein